MRLYETTITTAADGSATAYLPSSGKCRGHLESIQYEKDDFADTVDFTITDEETGENLWVESNVTASKVCRPRAPTHTQVGVAATLDGTVAALDRIAIVSRIKIVIAAGGNATSGTFRALID